MQSESVLPGYRGGPSILSKRNVGQSGEVYLLDFLGIFHKVTICSSPQKKVVACDQTENVRAFLEVDMAAMPGRDVDLLEEIEQCWMLCAPWLHLLGEKREREEKYERTRPL